MERKNAFEELKIRIENENTIKHSLAVEAIMRKLALTFNEPDNLWGLAGLLHDIDYERINGDMSLHGNMGGDILEVLNYDNTVVYAVRAHNPANNLPRRRRIDKALYCADPMAGLIVACALILPDKKLSEVTVDFVINRYQQKGFARNVNREQIASCSEIELTLEEFVTLSLEAMKEISDQIGL